MMKGESPVIGISTEIDIPERIAVKKKYVDAVVQAGASLSLSLLRMICRFCGLLFLLSMLCF